jgi:hypothetical protein
LVAHISKEVPEIKLGNHYLKPFLTEMNKFHQVIYAINQITEDENGKLYFKDGYNEIHMDEKWFYMFQKNKKYYVVDDEDDEEKAIRRAKHKSHIPKLMFLAAVACPCFDDNGICTFNGKIGIWAFADWMPAERSSINRLRGMMEIKPLSVTKGRYFEYVTRKVIPTIQPISPRGHDGNCRVDFQHDNAPVYFLKESDEWQQFKVQPEKIHLSLSLVLNPQIVRIRTSSIWDFSIHFNQSFGMRKLRLISKG